MLVNEFHSAYDVSDAVATMVQADVTRTWDALGEVDLIEVGRKRPLVAALSPIRILPDVVSHVLHGRNIMRHLTLLTTLFRSLLPVTVAAQPTGEVHYFHLDAIGSVRLNS